MAISKYEAEALVKQGEVIDLVPVAESQPLSMPTPAPPAVYNPTDDIKGHGLRGRLRALHIIWTFALYHVFVYAYHRGWFIGKKDESEEKHLQWQANWLSGQLLKLGPTFIKIGQAVSTRADLLPLAYIKELSKLQDSVPAFPNEVAMATIERELGHSIADLYAEIDWYELTHPGDMWIKDLDSLKDKLEQLYPGQWTKHIGYGYKTMDMPK